jgi:hypothetical protein
MSKEQYVNTTYHFCMLLFFSNLSKIFLFHVGYNLKIEQVDTMRPFETQL